jgi:hypothetical protein
LDEYTAGYLPRLLSVQSQPWFRQRLSLRTRRAITGVTEGDQVIAEDHREIKGDSKAITEGSREVTAEARGVMGAITKKARYPTCC